MKTQVWISEFVNECKEYKWMKKLVYSRKEWMNEWINNLIFGKVKGWMYEYMKGWVYEWIFVWKNEWKDEWMNEYPTCRYARNSSSISLSSPLKLGFVATCFPGWGSRKQDISEKQEVRLLLNRIIFINKRSGCFWTGYYL